MTRFQHVWVCSCGAETPCTFEDMRLGGYFRCPACGEASVGLLSKDGRKVFVKLDRAHVEFTGLFDPPAPAAEDAGMLAFDPWKALP